MLEFIQQNKEWLFSGVGVTLIGVIFAWIFHKKSDGDRKTQVVIHVHNKKEKITVDNYEEMAPASIEKISPVNFKMIKETIGTALPLQQDEIKKSFIGIKVEWDTFLHSAEKDNEGFVRLSLTPNNDELSVNLIFCKVLLSEYKELGILPKGAKIRIHGEIEKVEILYINLKNVKLFFYDK